ncbi:dinitrogenase reductase activationg glycohydrolase [Xanthomonas bromi]|uniref:Dinitrogenase reductase activationg glycohydrolase n=1 Tax=Xanthomonas bromi TaxID=56449 RepID=A0A1C3NJB1_9XANT|nr:dinitrogenase reductase activationg glycohydrolase [Xanthomonas bromi]
MTEAAQRARFRGCLLGLAVGDALALRMLLSIRKR